MTKGKILTSFIQAKYLLVIMVFMSFSSFSQSFEDFQNAKTMEKKISVAEALAYDYVKDNLDSLVRLGHELLKESNNKKHELGIFTARRIIGTYKIRTSEIEDGLELLRSSKNFFLGKENFTAVTEVCNEIGNAYQYSGKIDDAIKWYKESLKYGKIASDDNIKNIALVNLAQAYIIKSDFEKAEAAALEYRDWVLAIGAIDAISNSYAVLGNIELQSEDFANAISYFQHCEKFARKSGSKTQLAHAYTNLGISAFYLGEKEKCVNYFIQALELNKSIQNVKPICDSYLNLGGVYFELADFGKAELYYLEGLELAKTGKIYASQIEFLEALMELKKEEGKPTKEFSDELKLVVEQQNKHVDSQNKIDRELEKDLLESKRIQRDGFDKSNSKLPFYIGSGILFLAFAILALRKRLV